MIFVRICQQQVTTDMMEARNNLQSVLSKLKTDLPPAQGVFWDCRQKNDSVSQKCRFHAQT